MGFSLGHILLLLLVGIIVVGPKRLPIAMRTAGQWIARLRRMSTDLRSQSGLDDILRQEGLDEHIHELRSLSRFNVVDTLMAPSPAIGSRPTRPISAVAASSATLAGGLPLAPLAPIEPSREREHPLVGCDAYGALADDVAAYLPSDTQAWDPVPSAPTGEAAAAANATPGEAL